MLRLVRPNNPIGTGVYHPNPCGAKGAGLAGRVKVL
jgi:hypothetical protein